jgi:hypothetical protein
MFRPFRMLHLVTWMALAAYAQDTQPTPKTYDLHRTPTPINIDGKLNDPAWKKAKWTTDFVDIEGSAKPKPRFRTRAKMLWDDQYLYIAAELQEPDVKATLTKHDSVIFHDNDFEVFIKPLPETDSYYEFGISSSTSHTSNTARQTIAGRFPDSRPQSQSREHSITPATMTTAGQSRSPTPGPPSPHART